MSVMVFSRDGVTSRTFLDSDGASDVAVVGVADDAVGGVT
jgi:hypothetical protein